MCLLQHSASTTDQVHACVIAGLSHVIIIRPNVATQPSWDSGQTPRGFDFQVAGFAALAPGHAHHDTPSHPPYHPQLGNRGSFPADRIIGCVAAAAAQRTPNAPPHHHTMRMPLPDTPSFHSEFTFPSFQDESSGVSLILEPERIAGADCLWSRNRPCTWTLMQSCSSGNGNA